MNITDKITTTHYIDFTEEDLALILYATKKVWSFANVNTLIDNFDTGFAKVLNMIRKIRGNVLYHEELDTDDYDLLETLSSTLCTFESRYERDDRFQEVDNLWLKVTESRRLRNE
jgi:hypothetical protein